VGIGKGKWGVGLREPESLARELAWFVRREFGVVGTRFVKSVVGDDVLRVRESVWSGVLDGLDGVFGWR